MFNYKIRWNQITNTFGGFFERIMGHAGRVRATDHGVEDHNKIVFLKTVYEHRTLSKYTVTTDDNRLFPAIKYHSIIYN